MRKLGTLSTLTVHTPPTLQRLQMGSGNKERSGEREDFHLPLLPDVLEDSSQFHPVGKYITGPEKIFTGHSATPPSSPLRKERIKINLFYFSS